MTTATLPLPALTSPAFSGPEAEDAMYELALARLRAGELGTAIAAPSSATIESDRYPLVGCHVTRPGAPDCPPFDQFALLVARDQETGEVFVARAFDPPPTPPPAASGGGGAMTSFTFTFDLRRRLNLPERPAAYDVCLLVRERRSNTIEVRLEHDPSTFQDPAVEEFLQRALVSAGPPAVAPTPGVPFPAYGEVPEAPPPPDEAGIALAVDRVVVLDEGARCVVRGCFRLPVLPHERAPRTGSLEDMFAPAAVVPLTVLVFATDDLGPVILPIAVPVYGQLDPADPTALVVGQFALDLLEVSTMWRTPRTYFVWVLGGGVVAGPFPTALVTPDLVPRRR